MMMTTMIAIMINTTTTATTTTTTTTTTNYNYRKICTVYSLYNTVILLGYREVQISVAKPV